MKISLQKTTEPFKNSGDKRACVTEGMSSTFIFDYVPTLCTAENDITFLYYNQEAYKLKRIYRENISSFSEIFFTYHKTKLILISRLLVYIYLFIYFYLFILFYFIIIFFFFFFFWGGGGASLSQSSPLRYFPSFFPNLVTNLISHFSLAGLTAAMLWWHLLDMNVVGRI